MPRLGSSPVFEEQHNLTFVCVKSSPAATVSNELSVEIGMVSRGGEGLVTLLLTSAWLGWWHFRVGAKPPGPPTSSTTLERNL